MSLNFAIFKCFKFDAFTVGQIFIFSISSLFFKLLKNVPIVPKVANLNHSKVEKLKKSDFIRELEIGTKLKIPFEIKLPL